MAARNARVKDRVNDDPGAAAIVASAMKRVERKKGAVAAAKKKAKRASGTKNMHGVEHHAERDSSRQVDGVDTVDRDNDAPTQWRRPSNLDAPDPRPGYIQKWGRYRAGNSDDIDNLEKLMDQGWRPRERSTAKRGHELTARSSGQYGKYYVKRGLMLMEMPEKMARQRNAFYLKKLQSMTESVERDLLNENNRVMPVLAPEKRTRVTRAARRGNLEASIPEDDE